MGAIDPALYREVDADDDYEVTPDHVGRIWFAVQYERESEKLLVTIMKARNLLNHGNGVCDPFVR